MACSGCGQKRSAPPPVAPAAATRSMAATESAGDDDWGLHRLVDGNRGEHLIVGFVTKTRYGYRADGDIFLVHRTDVAAEPGKFERVYEGGVVLPEAPAEETPEPVAIVAEPEPEPVEEAPKPKRSRSRKTSK